MDQLLLYWWNIEVHHKLHIRKVHSSSYQISGYDAVDLEQSHLLEGYHSLLLTLLCVEQN